MATVIFADGSMISGESWKDLELALRTESWNPSGKSEFREEMARRAWNWSRTAVVTDRTARALFESLEAAGMLTIVEEEEN